jgi:DNA mismatch repair protein MutS
LEQRPTGKGTKGRQRVMSAAAPEHMTMQLTLFAPPSPVVAAIRELDVESLSPLEALTKLFELKRLAVGESAPDE